MDYLGDLRVWPRVGGFPRSPSSIGLFPSSLGSKISSPISIISLVTRLGLARTVFLTPGTSPPLPRLSPISQSLTRPRRQLYFTEFLVKLTFRGGGLQYRVIHGLEISKKRCLGPLRTLSGVPCLRSGSTVRSFLPSRMTSTY